MNAALRKRLEALEAQMAKASPTGGRVVFRTMVGIDGIEDAHCLGLRSNHGAALDRQEGETLEDLYQRARDASPAGRVTGWRWIVREAVN